MGGNGAYIAEWRCSQGFTMSPYPSLAVANYFIEQANSRFGRSLDPLKLQKLIYFAHGWNLAISGRPLINEPVEAWPYGPVIPSVYHEFKAYGRDDIDLPAYIYDYVSGDRIKPAVPEEDRTTLDLLDRIWKTYGRFSGTQLSAMTHQPGSPWAITRQKALAEGQQTGNDIPNHEIMAYFKEMALSSRRPAAHLVPS